MPLPILVVKCDSLVSITENSIKANMPDWEYKVVPYEDGFVATALNNIDTLTLVVRSGVILNLKEKDLPTAEMLEKYDICISKDTVFGDHPNHNDMYRAIGKEDRRQIVDLSVFIINPNNWNTIPKSDSNILQKVKRLKMPRYMNHKTDVLVKNTLTAKIAVDYGMLAEQASVFNYVPIYKTGKANGNQMLAYALEKVLPYTDNLDPEDKQLVESVACQTLEKFAKLRTGLAASLN